MKLNVMLFKEKTRVVQIYYDQYLTLMYINNIVFDIVIKRNIRGGHNGENIY